MVQIFFVIGLIPWFAQGQIHEQEGYLVKGKSENFLISRQRSWPMTAEILDIKETFSELNSWDFLRTTLMQGEKGTYQVIEIESVGLRRILGVWKSSTATYTFTDFENLIEKKNGERRRMNYRIIPEHGEGWTILLVHKGSARAGKLVVTGNQLRLELMNGQSMEVINLVKVP